MTDATAPAPRRGWWWLVLAVVVFTAAAGVPMAHTLLPVHDALLLVLPSLAVCAVVGWWRGGSGLLTVTLLAAAAVPVARTVAGGVAVELLTAGWSVLAGGCLGIALLAARSTRFLVRGVAAVLGALLVSAVLLAVTPRGPGALAATVTQALEVRGNVDLTIWRMTRSQMMRSGTQRTDSATTALLDRVEQTVGALPQLARLVLPSMLALQTLAGMAVAWALFHRFSRTRLGAELGRLRDFRFDDQWIWSVIVGLVIALLPALVELRPLGINLLVFFGALYAMRGAAVLAWFLRPGRSLLGLLVGVALLLLLRDGAAIALGLVGVGDTWADWRRRIRPAVS